MNIELKGFNGHGWRVCDNCPCDQGDGCCLGYEQGKGVMKTEMGLIMTESQCKRMRGEMANYTVLQGWYGITIRPQECIQKHGK